MGSIMRPPLRIAILECDTPLEQARTTYGGYGGIFKAMLEAGSDLIAKEEGEAAKPELKISSHNIEGGDQYPKLEDIDAILLTGSRFNAFDDNPWIVKLVDFTKSVLEQDRVRIIGACFGHQIVGRALGVAVDRSKVGWETSVTPVELSPKGKEIFRKLALSLFQMHRDIVTALPDGVIQLGTSPRCAVQGMYSPKRLITVQGHPEFNETIVRELLESRHLSGVFDDAQYEDAMARVGNEHDGVVVSAAFLRFLME